MYHKLVHRSSVRHLCEGRPRRIPLTNHPLFRPSEERTNPTPPRGALSPQASLPSLELSPESRAPALDRHLPLLLRHLRAPAPGWKAAEWAPHVPRRWPISGTPGHAAVGNFLSVPIAPTHCFARRCLDSLSKAPHLSAGKALLDQADCPPSRKDTRSSR